LINIVKKNLNFFSTTQFCSLPSKYFQVVHFNSLQSIALICIIDAPWICKSSSLCLRFFRHF